MFEAAWRLHPGREDSGVLEKLATLDSSVESQRLVVES